MTLSGKTSYRSKFTEKALGFCLRSRTHAIGLFFGKGYRTRHSVQCSATRFPMQDVIIKALMSAEKCQIHGIKIADNHGSRYRNSSGMLHLRLFKALSWQGPSSALEIPTHRMPQALSRPRANHIFIRQRPHQMLKSDPAGLSRETPHH